MFNKMGNMMKQIQMAQKLMKDENFKTFMSHPKVQTLIKDPEFMSAMQSKNPESALNNPKIAGLKEDPELAEMIKKLDFSSLFGK